ncbi:hypothetical protein PN36_24865 [Candidatus Thiomargarita nelsonii]|uniref:HicB family protein n=1 Tax=Candidatus Thiomargarita nelsonii TaxID=1003181 RepID=A0A4E0QM46_9GAMM|nr:hypothetical protein PN36_24865 [Candidatus Thiomargarita nelsonii]
MDYDSVKSLFEKPGILKCSEYVAEYADYFGEAYQLAIDTIQTSMKMFAEKGKSFPPPLKPEDDEYNGRLTLRLPKYLHRKIARTAQQEEINFYITRVM